MPASVVAWFRQAFEGGQPRIMAGGAAILLTLVLLSLFLASTAQESVNQVLRERSVRLAAGSVRTALILAETNQRGYLLTGNPDYLAPYSEAKERLIQAIRDLDGAFARTPDHEEVGVADIDRIARAKLREMQQTIDLAGSGRRDDALQLVQTEQGRMLMVEVDKLLRTAIDNAETKVAASISRLTSAATQLTWSTVLAAGGITLLAIVAWRIVAGNTAGLVEARQNVEMLNATLEDRVTERTTALTRANDEIQRFAYIVSHDLRSPLVNIMGFTSELEMSAETLAGYFNSHDPTPDQRAVARTAARDDIPEAIRFIKSSTARMDGLIGAILKLSREGRRQLKRERVDLASLIATVTAAVKHQADSASTTIEVETALPVVLADRLALEQVFANLLDNAIKYLVDGRPGHIRVSAVSGGPRVKVRISDNGRGIDEKDYERVFELFRRAGPQDRPGDGVGLAHVRALVRRMGGDVTVRSTVGVGSEFEVELPRVTVDMAERSL